MQKRKVLIFALMIALAMIVFLAYFSQRKYTPYDPSSDEYEKNNGLVLNQGNDFLKYNNSAYFLDGNSKSVISYDFSTDRAVPIIKMKSSKIDEDLYIVSNKIIYSVDGSTYYCDLDGKNSLKFTNGDVIFVNEDIYVYITQDSSGQHLYMASYDNKTFQRTNKLFYNLANGYKIRFIKEIDGMLFLESENSDNTMTLFYIDLNESKTNIVEKMKKNRERKFI